MSRLLVNGIQLNVEQRGSGPPLVLLHGFTGSAATWAPHTAYWAREFTTYAIDLIGHGRSDAPADPARYRMEQCVADLVALFDVLGLQSTALLGYSMGGRVALHLALAAPTRVEALILESASPGIADPAERSARVRADEALADSIERDGLEAFIDRWEQIPLFASQERLAPSVRASHRTQRLSNCALGLANSLRGMGAGAMEPVWERLGEIDARTMLIVGALDRKYVELSTRIEPLLPRVKRSVLAEAGHAAHLEVPERFDRLVREWLLDREVR